MCRFSYRMAFALWAALMCVPIGATEPGTDEAKLDELRKKPITTAKGELGDLLTKWWKEGTAAGNAGDWYDNRDGAHSDLDTSPYPQLQRIVYSPDDIKNRRNWALTVGLRPQITFGNSSTSAPPTMGGSNPRHAYVSPRGLALLSQQYKGNNVYIYPEHRDHDPGHNGRGDGYGDMYPTNTPYLLISQGSSGSDQPFMRAIPFTLAAFRPEVKQKLAGNGLLMPTLQMILRSTNKQLANPKEYLSGKSHPSVFEGPWVDALKMVKLAHEITLGTLPPAVRLNVVEEDAARGSRDFFDPPGATEKLADTPEVIARIWRSSAGRRRMVVSAADSFDLNKKPLTFTWVVLRGDEKQIQITPRNQAGSEVEIVVPYQPRRPVSPGNALESNRVDIGVFVHNGAYYSAPGFITFCTLDNESRAYDEKGRLLEIGFSAGEVEVRVSDFDLLLKALAPADGLAAALFKITGEQRSAFNQADDEYLQCRGELEVRRGELKKAEATRADDDSKMKKAQAEVDAAKKAAADKPSEETKTALALALKKADGPAAARKQSDALVQSAQKAIASAQKKLDEVLAVKRPGLGDSVNDFVNRTLRQAWQRPDLFDAHFKIFAAALEKSAAGRKSAFEAARQRLIDTGLASGQKSGGLAWHPIRPGDVALAERLTPFEMQLIERFNAALLSELVLPGAVVASTSPNFVDQRLYTPKSWRDVYRYDSKGKLIGWARYDGKVITEFTDEGLIVLEKDSDGRAIRAQVVEYRQLPAKDPARPGNLVVAPINEIVTYAYVNGERVEKSRSQGR